MELLKALGLDVRILIAQLVNFAILVFVLWKWGYKPLLKLMSDRRSKIEKGIEEARLAHEKLEKAEKDSDEILRQAKKKAADIINDIKKRAEEKKKEIVVSAQEEVAQVINSEKEKLQQEKIEISKELKNEMVDLIILATSKLLVEKVDVNKDKELVEKIIKELK